MARPVVGIYASTAPADWGPWRGRPSAVAPAALGAAIQRAGGVVVLLAPGADPGLDHLLSSLDALIVFDDAAELLTIQETAREHGLQVLVLAASQITPHCAIDACARAIAGFVPSADQGVRRDGP